MRVERAFNPDSSLGRSSESMATSMASTPSVVFAEEKKGVIKSGTLQGGFTPFKGKGKSMYVVLSERAMEIYESERAYMKKKPSKYTIDLAIAFNVHNEHYDPKLVKCVCVMRPDDTLLLKADSDQMNQEWFEAILGVAVPARALRLGRCATPAEFFEAAYDVQIVATPIKTGLTHKRTDETPVANIIDRHPHLGGSRRLCFYAHTIFLCLKNIEPGKEGEIHNSGIPPFKAIHAFEIQRKFIPNFGYRDQYFVLVMGRNSPMGGCEMWAECENRQTAEHIHHMLNDIIEREAEKKRRLNNGQHPDLPPVPQMPRPHRERSHTQPHRPRAPTNVRNGASPLAGLMLKPHTGTEKCTAGHFRTPPCKLGDPSTSTPNATLPVPGQRHSFAAPSDVRNKLLPHSSIFPVRRQSETIKEVKEEASYQPMDPQDESRKKEWEQIMRGEMKGAAPSSPSAKKSSGEETEDSGGTLKCFGEGEDSGGTLKESRPATPPQTAAGSIRNLSLVQQEPKPFVPIKSKADHLSSSEDDADADADVISAGTNTSTGGESSMAGEDYAHMDLANWNGEGSTLSVPPYKLNTPRSFVSSTDSCYSSMAERAQLRGHDHAPTTPHEGPQPQIRSYSFGPGHPSYQRPTDSPQETIKLSAEAIASSPSGETPIMNGKGSSATTVAGPKEDPRKRAFSLGSKNFFAYCSRPFRKVSSRARQSATSASGASLASSTISSGPPPSSASSNHIATLGHPAGDDAYRNRSGSFGSGRSTPYSRRSGPVNDSHDHLMELDFTGNGVTATHHGLGGRCGSGSMGSVDSPSRSRTSSFGCNNLKRGDEADDNGGLTPSQILLAKAKQQSIEAEAAAAKDDSDYVLTEAPSATSPRGGQQMTLSLAAGHHPHAHHHYHQLQQQHSPDHAVAPPPPAVQHGYTGGVLDVMGKTHDARNSQYFETIEETTSGRSSRASSIDEGSTRADEEVPKLQPQKQPQLQEDDDYAEMEIGSVQPEQPAEAAAAAADPATPTAEEQPAAAPQLQLQLQPTDSKGSSRSRSASPSVSSTRRVDSSSTLQSMASDRSDRENKDASPAAAAAAATAAEPKLQLPQPLRQKISTQSEGPQGSLLAAPAGLPKRSSVPVLKDHGREEAGAAGDGAAAALNYACLQLNGEAASHESSRARSKSGILFPAAKETTAAAAAAAPAAADPVDYTVVKPLP